MTNQNGITEGTPSVLPPAVEAALALPLDPAIVQQRRGKKGRTFSYIEGHTAIDQANAIFGYGGWGFELAGEIIYRAVKLVDTKTGEASTAEYYAAPVRVTAFGAPPRTDIGFASVNDDDVDAHEVAMKGAVTDGMKRALRSFGDRFGNGLYGAPTPRRAPAAPGWGDSIPDLPPAGTPRAQAQPTATSRPQHQPASPDPPTSTERALLLDEARGRFALMHLSPTDAMKALQQHFGKQSLSALSTDELKTLLHRLDARADSAKGQQVGDA